MLENEEQSLRNLVLVDMLNRKGLKGSIRGIFWNCRTDSVAIKGKEEIPKTGWLETSVNPEYMMIQEVFSNVYPKNYQRFEGLRRFIQGMTKEKKKDILAKIDDHQETNIGTPALCIYVKKGIEAQSVRKEELLVIV